MIQLGFSMSVFVTILYFIRLKTNELRRLDAQQFQSSSNKVKTEFDFIVGGGTAGCLVAGRLSEKFNVLLVEAGGDPPSVASVPGFRPFLKLSPEIRYLYTSIPQKRANNRQLTDVMGKMLGGTGSQHGLTYNRGHPNDYNIWANITQDPTWSYDSLLPIFKKVETYKGIWPENGQHGSHGPIQIETLTNPGISSPWKKAAAELGYTYSDPNTLHVEGFASLDVMRKDGRRVSTYTAYVQPYLWRQTLNIIRYAFVHKILFRGKRAIGIEYVRHGVKLQAFATKEVIISAGSYASPLILMKSGIGPKEILKEAKIHQRIELPVGKNLQNHQGLRLGPFTVKDHSKIIDIRTNLTEEVFDTYLNGGREHVLSETGVGPQVFLVSPEAKKRNETNWSDMRLVLEVDLNNVSPYRFTMPLFISRPEYSPQFLGTVRLNTTAYKEGSTENEQLAVIDFKFMKSKQDYKIYKFEASLTFTTGDVIDTGVKMAFKIIKTKAFKRIGTKYEKDKNCDRISKSNKSDYWDCYLRKNGLAWFHPVGTCRMGHGDEDKNSVVDSKLFVKGIKRLRVVDASIIPQITNANTNAAVVVIAEKVSMEILRKYSKASPNWTY